MENEKNTRKQKGLRALQGKVRIRKQDKGKRPQIIVMGRILNLKKRCLNS